MLVNIDDIIVGHRIRQDMGELEPLIDSLRRYGLLNPITIDDKNHLIAGGRRLLAAKALGWTFINANVINSTSNIQALEMELEENNQRKEFTTDELLSGYKKLDKLNNPSLLTKLIAWVKQIFTKIVTKFKVNKP